jgi:hypothetical protein
MNERSAAVVPLKGAKAPDTQADLVAFLFCDIEAVQLALTP